MGISNPISTGAWRKIKTVTVAAGNPSSVTIFSAESLAAYKRVILVLDLKMTAASLTDWGVQFNNDSAANYHGQMLDFTTASAGVVSQFGAGTFAYVASSSTALAAINGTFAFNPNRDMSNNVGAEIEIMSGTGQIYYATKAGYAAAAAITTVTLVQSGSLTFDQNGTITAYGLEG